MAAGVWAFTWEILPALAWVAVGVAVLAWALPNHAQNARERLNWVISHLLYRLLMWQMGVRPSPTLGPRYLLINVSLRQTKYNAVQIPARKSRIPRLPTHHGLRSAPLTCQISSATTTRARKVNVCYAWKNWCDHKIELRKVSEVRGQHEFQAPNPLRAKSPQLKFAGSPKSLRGSVPRLCGKLKPSPLDHPKLQSPVSHVSCRGNSSNKDGKLYCD
jgi:hypothetical protein